MKRFRRVKWPVYRDGRIHVQAERCSTCIFWPGNRMHLAPGRLQELVQGAVANDSCIPCHDTLGKSESVCRGFYDGYATTPLRLARAMDLITFTEVVS